MNQIHTQNSLQGKTHWALWAVCLFSMVLAGFITNLKELMWVQYVREQGGLGTQFEAAQQFSLGASVVGVLLWAMLADVWGRKQALLLAWMGVALACGSLWLLPARFELLRWAHMMSALALAGIPVVSVVLGEQPALALWTEWVLAEWVCVGHVCRPCVGLCRCCTNYGDTRLIDCECGLCAGGWLIDCVYTSNLA